VEIIQEETTKQNRENVAANEDKKEDEEETVTLCLPYIGEEGTKIVKKM